MGILQCICDEERLSEISAAYMHGIRPVQINVKTPVISTSLGMHSVSIHVHFAVPRAFYQCGTHCKFIIQLVCATEFKRKFVLRETATGLSIILGVPRTNEVAHQPNLERLPASGNGVTGDAMTLTCACCAVTFASVGVSQG